MSTEMNLDGKVVIVTGAGSGLGRVMTLGLAGRGAKVAAFDVNEAAAAKTASEAPKGSVAPVRVDVRNVKDCEAAIMQTLSLLGGLHVLVNCAGLGMAWIRKDFMKNPVRFWEVTPDQWQQLMDVNVRGPFLLACAARPHMVAQKWGRIINVTTSFNTMIRGANMPYGQSKAALEGASSAWAEDLAGTGVTVNVLVPGGAADTPMVPQESRADRSTLVRPDAMVAPVCWLASDDSDGVTGLRFIGRDWDVTKPGKEAMKGCSAPIAWPDLANSAGAQQMAAGFPSASKAVS
jgi:NAD(P)-dependent dehydrogenase (short-subunit alcohol dehydrogenase family)